MWEKGVTLALSLAGWLVPSMHHEDYIDLANQLHEPRTREPFLPFSYTSTTQTPTLAKQRGYFCATFLPSIVLGI